MSKVYKWFDENIGFGGIALITLCLLTLSILVYITINSVSAISRNNENREYLKSRIGDKYVIGKDTLMVLKLDETNDIYLLSNGMYVMPEVIYKSKKVK